MSTLKCSVLLFISLLSIIDCQSEQAQQVTNTSGCSCELYGFDADNCDDHVLNGSIDIIGNVPSFTSIIKSGDTEESLVRKYIEFLIAYGGCETSSKSISMIKYCPIGTPDRLKESCENPNSTLPHVQFEEQVVIIFQNEHCAVCHGVPVKYVRKHMTSWTSELHCNSTTSPESGVCVNSYEHQKNAFPWENIIRTVPAFKKSGLTVLFSVNTKPEVVRMFKSSQMCLDNENFDLLYRRCRRFVCPQGQLTNRNTCLKINKTLVSGDTQPYPHGSTGQLVKVELTKVRLVDYLIRFSDIVNEMFFRIPGNTTAHVMKNISINWEDSETAELRILSAWGVSGILDYLSNLTNSWESSINLFIHVSNMNDTNANISCVNGEVQCFNDPLPHVINETIFAEVMYHTRSVWFPIDNVLYNLTLSVAGEETSISHICVCSPNIDEFENCSFPLYIYEPREYIIMENEGLELIESRLPVEESDVYFADNRTLICFDPHTHLAFFRFDDVKMYVSMVCSGLSILFLVLTVIFYTMFKDLRNLPGKLIIGLSVFLILGQALLFVRDLEVDFCKYVAVLTHFCWLSVFLWMSCISCNMLITFHPKMLATSLTWRRGNRAFGTYCTICLIIPGVICGSLLTLDVIKGDHFHIQYGVLSCCWMSNRYGYIFAFFVPVAVTLMFNLICFGITLFYIEKTLKTSEDVTGRKRDRSRCKIYIRLSSVMGSSWMFGFIASAADVPALWYVFIVLNGLQGVFIFLSFSVNTRAPRLLRKKLSNVTFSSMFGRQYETKSTTQ